jgi:DUF1009 family protein
MNISTLPKLGIIAGEGMVPVEFSAMYMESGGTVVYANLSDKSISIDFKAGERFIEQSFSIGQVGKVIDFFHQHNVINILMVGKVARPKWHQINPDTVGAKLLATITKQKLLGDDNILRIVATFLANYRLNIISPREVLELTNYENTINTLSCGKVSREQLADIELGTQVLDALGTFDIGQSIIVENGRVLGIEAAEGTDELIKRCASLRIGNKSCGILIKKPKIAQDLRLDLPTIGYETVKLLDEHHYAGIAITKTNMLVVEHQKILDTVKKGSLFLRVI